MTGASRLRAVLFDLDGTLVDTAPDLTYAVNAVRSEAGCSPLPDDVVRPQVSNGSTALIRLAFGIDEDHPGFEPRRQRLLELYRANVARLSRPFVGMEDVLDALERRGLRWGVVTNKPAWLTLPLMEALDLARRAGCVVSGDTTPRRKPHPDPLLHAAQLLDLPAAQCLYVGDAPRDVAAAHAAGMRALVASYGYIESGADPGDWGAEALLAAPEALLDWLSRDFARQG